MSDNGTRNGVRRIMQPVAFGLIWMTGSWVLRIDVGPRLQSYWSPKVQGPVKFMKKNTTIKECPCCCFEISHELLTLPSDGWSCPLSAFAWPSTKA
ncbi:hypothetical protein CaCOL14_002469 [Colletotrichum acutatum]